jgi:cytochrome oxidase Cu insertion factor (SCO1/SenC/PrrC family)
MSDAPRRKNLVSLWLIVALTTAPVAASYLMYYFWPPGRTVNYGALIEPHPLPDVELSTPDGRAFRLAELKGKWVLVMVDSGRCGARCEQKLFTLRQLRLTQGKNSDRVERLWLINDDAAPAAPVPLTEGARLVRAGATLLRAFPAQGSVVDHIYVVDPLGNLMMRFPRDPDPKLMIKDLARLLKASQVG